MADRDRPGSSPIEPGSLFVANYRGGPAGLGALIQSSALGVSTGPQLGSDILLGRRPGTGGCPRPQFDVVDEGYEPDQVQTYLSELTAWACAQARRADSAEEMLRAALEQLRGPVS